MSDAAKIREAVELWDDILKRHPGSDLAYYTVLDAARTHADLLDAGKTMWLCGSGMAPRCSEGQAPVFGPEGHESCGRFLVAPVDLEENQG